MAFTEKYVSSLAGGSGNGLTAGTPFTWAQMVAEINGGLGAGIRYNVKADGVYARTAYDSMWAATGGTATSPVYIRGYKTTIGDGYLGRDSNGALITTNMPQLNYTDGRVELSQRMVLESLSFAYTATGSGVDVFVQVNHWCSIIGCKISTARTNGDSKIIGLGGDWALHFECDYFMTAATGPNQQMAFSTNTGVRVDSCRFICSCTTLPQGIKCDDGIGFYGCLIKGAGSGAGLYADGNKVITIRNCTITGWQDGIFWNTPSNDRTAWIAGNMITDNSRYGINLSTGTAWVGLIGPNRTRDNVSGDTSSSTLDWSQTGRIIPLVTTDTGGPATDYVNTSVNNYNLIQASPGKGVNVPKISDLGAYGLPDPSGGGGSAVFHSLENFIIQPA
jgi:hypothetical protein